jgi:hypothetical protein
MKLILIHGRSQQGKDPVLLQQEWLTALQIGLDKNGLQLPPSVTIEFPFYGDKLDALLHQLETPTVEDVVFRGVEPDDNEAAFRQELVEEIRKGEGISDAKIQAHYDLIPHEKGPLNWGWVQAILKALDETPLGEKAIDNFTRDVYVYLTINGVRKAINAIVEASFSDEPCVVVGHSLGTVVGYNVLSKLPATTTVKKYITVGSPLGLNAIQKQLDSPLAMPPCVTGGWFNAFDERDVVALHALNKRHFNINPPIENKTDVNNHTDNRHGIVGYLDDAVVAAKIHQAVTSDGIDG